MPNPKNELKATVEARYTDGALSALSVKTSGTLNNGEAFHASSFHHQPHGDDNGIVNIIVSPEYAAARNSHDELFRKTVQELFLNSNTNIKQKNATTIDSITIYTPAGSADSVEP
ncbi:hypothetical protein BZ16_2526 [Yersinia pseudotuberculosis PB1/+]|uniref:hypothetical protein n=1 Tax=Yersinia pseudotuberculosis TaxID=633 RepID=UPI00017397D9|nr:hypothetical protein [Yersinia pseudotuberculosis]AJJ67975.1 hypothetical protein BZ16_2526 [Yersinia pseudotuberculosis PB1/+]